MSAALQTAGRIALAIAVSQQPLFLAWGRGLPAWDATPEDPPTDATALIDEVGRLKVTEVTFCTPDAAGALETRQGRYTASAAPTQWLYCRFLSDYDNASGETLRELGLFIGTEVKTGLPAGQRYFTPADMEDPGHLFSLEYVAAFTRDGAVKHEFGFVLPF